MLFIAKSRKIRRALSVCCLVLHDVVDRMDFFWALKPQASLEEESRTRGPVCQSTPGRISVRIGQLLTTFGHSDGSGVLVCA